MNTEATTVLVGIDTVGTFTDLVLFDGGKLRYCKVLSTPDDPSRAIAEGMDRLGLLGVQTQIVHGTTVGTNAVLENKGSTVAYVTSKGFADVLTLGRQNRDEVYRLEQPDQPPPVPRALCFEVSTRCSATGELLQRASDEELAHLAKELANTGVESVAVNLLFSFLYPEEETRILSALGPGLFVSCASRVLPESREYERGIATWLNASVGPVIARYLSKLDERLPQANISVMQSSGTTVEASQAADQAVRLLLSGPAGGIAAARMIGAVTGRPNILTLDMGGTSTDVSLLSGKIPLTTQSQIGRWPLTISTVDIHTIGAGGGSLAAMDEGGMLLVGPESAGANPGPACYGQGGQEVTVTDANLVLGRIPPETLLGGYLSLDQEAGKAAVSRLAARLGSTSLEAALGVVRMANEHMARALRVISVERGHDPRDYTLVCFGGAGGLHACEVAELLSMNSILLPARSGVLSAQGMLVAQPGRELSRAVLEVVGKLDEQWLDRQFSDLEDTAAAELESEGVARNRIRFTRNLEMRYLGQSAAMVLAFHPGSDHANQFHHAHDKSSGHQLDREVEVVNLRLSARAPARMDRLEKAQRGGTTDSSQVFMLELKTSVRVMPRSCVAPGESVPGPAIVTDPVATAWISPAWVAQADEWGNLVLSRNDSG